MDLSVIIPCLNEKDTIGICVTKALKQIKNNNIKGEVIVADNGSHDNSIQIALDKGARVINARRKGYGYAIQEGIKEAKGKYILMADADDSYDFNKVNEFFQKINQGYGLVNGCRLPAGGGSIEKRAMPLSHRYIGNPFFSWMARNIYSVKINDIYCGMKIFRRDVFNKLSFYFSGMVFNVELLIKFHLSSEKITEIPIVLHKDGRVDSQKHLNTISDGISTLKFFLIFCPRILYFIPSLLIALLGVLNLFLYSEDLIKISINYSLLLFFSSLLVSIQLFMLGLYTHLIARSMKLTKPSNFIENFFKVFTLKRAVILSSLIFVIAILMNLYKNAIPNFDEEIIRTSSIFLIILSIHIFFNSMFISLISLKVKI